MTTVLWILAAITTLAAGYLAYRADRRRAVPYPWLTASLRAFVIALVWALLLAPSIRITKTEIEKPVIVFLQDESASIPPALKGDTLTYRNSAQDLIRRLSQHYRVVTWGFGNSFQSDSFFRFRQPATDIAAPLARVQDFFGNQNLGAIILASDGRFNQGLHPLYQSLSLQSPLYAVSIGDTALPKDLRIPQVYANRTVARNAQLEVRADIVATRCAGYNGTVQISEGSATLGSSAISIPADRYDKSVSFTIRAGAPGLHHYVISIPPDEGEVSTANNRRDVFVEVVEAKKRILIAAAAPHPDIAALRDALSGTEAYTLTVRTGEGIPDNTADYDVIILHGLPAPGEPNTVQHKAVWYIVTASSGPFSTPAAASLAISPPVQHDAYAVANSSFSAFTPPQGLSAVLDRMPPLSAPAGSAMPGPGTQVLLSQRGDNIPLWLVQPGSTSQALLLGEGIWRWRFYEYRYFHNHNVVDECIRQTVATLATNTADAPFRVTLPKYEWSDGENIALSAYLLNAAGEQVNSADASITITDSAGKRQSFSFERSGSAYRLNIGQLPAGTYRFSASTTFNSRRHTASGSFVVASVPLETMESGADYALLDGLSRKYGGSAVRSQQMASLYDSITRNETIRPVLQSRETTVPLVDWKWYFFLILVAATAEWLLRKYWLAQ
jgi:hypothetical protein